VHSALTGPATAGCPGARRRGRRPGRRHRQATRAREHLATFAAQ